MKLEEIYSSKEVVFKLSQLEGREFNLRPLNLSDEIWLKETFKENADKIFCDDNIDVEAISRIVYHQIADKSFFIKREIKLVDESGNEKNEFIGGYKLLQYLISGQEDKLELLKALSEIVLFSRGNEEVNEDVKKKV